MDLSEVISDGINRGEIPESSERIICFPGKIDGHRAYYKKSELREIPKGGRMAFPTEELPSEETSKKIPDFVSDWYV
ncbi:hypothetical protein JW851_04115 [Candidatus Woesearchaeota archaeon]|nr:hypothetical protein [Candidatus Woesearchaeota archaeon]